MADVIGHGELVGAAAPAQGRRLALLRGWLWLLAALVFAMVVVGGATRMTGSGLSITEWRPLMGAIPPLDAAGWAAEFEKYRQIPQYKILNQGMTLEAFKQIYWWEWSHRQLGRAVGLVFALGFLGFVVTGVLRGRMAWQVAAVGVLGGLQGAVGWIMVASGLREGMTAVAPVKLMLHLLLASVIFCALVALATGIGDGGRAAPARKAGGRGRLAGVIVAAVLLQIALGALVAGSRAGLTYNTWPLMDGVVLPPLRELFIVDPWIENLVDNPLLVQFNHRMAAYLVLALALWEAVRARPHSAGRPAARRAVAVAGLVGAQAAIGIATLLAAVPLALGLAHQAFAMAVLAMATVHWRLSAAGR